MLGPSFYFPVRGHAFPVLFQTLTDSFPGSLQVPLFRHRGDNWSARPAGSSRFGPSFLLTFFGATPWPGFFFPLYRLKTQRGPDVASILYRIPVSLPSPPFEFLLFPVNCTGSLLSWSELFPLTGLGDTFLSRRL